MAKQTEQEIESKIIELGKQGLTSEKIGLELKKQGIKPNDYKKRVSLILKENNIHKPADIENLKKDVENLKKHSQNHPNDRTYRRALSIKEAKLRKLNKFVA